MLAIGAAVAAFTTIPSQSSHLVDTSSCQMVPSVLFPGAKRCLLHTETYHGGVGVVDVAISRRPTASTTAPGSFRTLSSVTPGFHGWGLVVQLLVSFGVAVPLVALIGFITRRSLRTPPYGTVRRRRRLRWSTRRF